MRICGDTKVIGFLGETYAKSRVYEIYNRAFRQLGMNFVYVPFRATDAGLAAEAVKCLGIHAVGVTMPFKVAIIPHLQELDERARRSGAVNVVTNVDGRLVGGNTDGVGAARALEEVTDWRGKSILIIGAGGAARSIGAELGQHANVRIVSILDEESQRTAAEVGCEWGGSTELSAHVRHAEVVVNATPLGTPGTPLEHQSAVAGEMLQEGQVVMDIVPRAVLTPLLRDATERGCTTISGDRMLLWQALLKLEIFTGQSIDMQIFEQGLKTLDD